MRIKALIHRAPAFFLAICFSPTIDASPAAIQPLDDPLEMLVPKTIRTEEDEDRLTAAALFSAGRMLEQRQKPVEALQRYQRALRYAPDAKPILREMLPLAFTLERSDVALRYLAAHIDDANITDPVLLRGAAGYLTAAGDWPAAVKIYRQIEGLMAKEKPSPTQVIVQMELGRLSFLMGNIADSATAYKVVLDALSSPKKFRLDAKTRKAITGDDGEIFELMGSIFLEAKQPENARRAFELRQKLAADSSRQLLNSARVELVAGNPQRALDELQKYFDTKKLEETVTPYEVLSAALDELDQSDQLISRLEALHESHPENATLAFFLGEQYRKAMRSADAANMLQAAIDAEPTADAYQSLSQIYRQTRDAERMLKLLGSAAEKSGSLSVLDDETKAIIKDEELLSAIIAAAKQRHAEVKQADAGPLRAVALLASEATRWDDAETLMNLAMKADPKAASGLLMAWGLDLFLAEKYDRAAAVFQRAIDEKALPDDNPAFYFYLAGALEMENKSDEALAAARHAAKIKRDDPMIAGRPAWILYHAKRYEEAEKEYKTFVEKFDSDFTTPGARESVQQAKQVLSHLCALRHDLPMAVEYLEQVLDEFPDDAGANNDLGYLWADENQHLQRAYRMVQLAVAEEPENAAYRDSLGWALYRLGRFSEALVELQKALDLQKADDEEPDATVLDHLGDVYTKLGRTADAQAAWKQSVAAFEREKEMDKVKAVKRKLNPND